MDYNDPKNSAVKPGVQSSELHVAVLSALAPALLDLSETKTIAICVLGAVYVLSRALVKVAAAYVAGKVKP